MFYEKDAGTKGREGLPAVSIEIYSGSGVEE